MSEAQPIVPPGYCQCGCGAKTNLADQAYPKRGIAKGMPFQFISGHHARLSPGPPTKLTAAEKRTRHHAYHPKAGIEASKRWMARNPEKRSAHRRVEYALKVGLLKREPCEVCGANEVHAHHDDYTKPLEVRWLCRTHHVQEHRGC